MKVTQIIPIFAALAGSALLSSCGCCTGEERPPGLRPLPAFNDVPAPVIEDAK